MEEIITLDGRQFKLTVDRPLTASEKAQVIADIRKQTGCGGGCGQRAMGNDWQYGGIRTMAPTCTAVNITSGTPRSVAATPSGGTGPYRVRFLKQIGGMNGGVPQLLSAGPGTLVGSDDQAGLVEGTTTSAVTYNATDSEIIAGATGAALQAEADPGVPSGIGLVVLAANSIRLLTHTIDSCPAGTGGPKHCVEFCDLAIVCPTPTCNFVVT